MKQIQRGFTLIELVMVIVILGVLAAVAIPKFVDLKSDARTAALAGVAGALSSAAAINYAARSANVAKGNAVANCSARWCSGRLRHCCRCCRGQRFSRLYAQHRFYPGTDHDVHGNWHSVSCQVRGGEAGRCRKAPAPRHADLNTRGFPKETLAFLPGCQACAGPA
jgi:prepilin-type N-terminal cleavage/methylation domain-containing protein